MYYDDRCHGIMGGADADRAEIRSDCQTDKRDFSFYFISFSEDSKEPSGAGIYLYESDCEYSRAGLGVYAGRALSYYNDRLKNPLRNQGFPPNLVLMKKCSFACKSF